MTTETAAKLPWCICGRDVGVSSGWDQADTFVLQLYDFEPASGYTGPVGDVVSFDFENGVIQTWDDDGNVLESADLIGAITNCRRQQARSGQ